MNKKGQMGMGSIILLFIGVIVAFALLPSIANGVDTMVSTRNAVNSSVTLSTVGVAVDMTGMELIGDATVLNATTGETLASNVTVAEGLSDGQKTIQITLGGDGTIEGHNYTDNAVFVTYEYGADGYADDAGTRGIANTIVIFSALGLLGFVVYYAIGKAGWLK